MWGVGLDFVLVCCLKSNGVFLIVGGWFCGSILSATQKGECVFVG